MDIRSLVEPTPVIHVLPVPLSQLQVDVTRELIFGNYSEILNFFDTTAHSSRLEPDGSSDSSLEVMMQRLEAVSTHPWLFVPSLRSQSLNLREAPGRMEEASGKFAVLGQIIKTIKSHIGNVAIVASARYPTTPNEYLTLMIEAYLNAAGAACLRYEGGTAVQPSKRLADGTFNTTFYLVHSAATARLSSEFDLVLFVNNADVAHLDPSVPAVRLVAPNTADNANLPGNRLDFPGRLAATVVMYRHLHANNGDLSYLKEFFPFLTRLGPWPLRSIVPMPHRYNRIDVERALSESSSVDDVKRIKLESPAAPAIANGSVSSFPVLTPIAAMNAQNNLKPHIQEDFVSLDQYNNLQREVESHRLLSTRRQNELDAMVEEVTRLAGELETLKRDCELAKKRRERSRDDMRVAVDHARSLGERWSSLELRLRESSESELKADLAKAEHRLEEYKQDLEKQEKRAQTSSETLEFMREQYQSASQVATELREEKDARDIEIQKLQNTIERLQGSRQEEAARALLSQRDEEIKWLKGELQSVQTAIKIAEEERNTQQPSRERSRQPR